MDKTKPLFLTAYLLISAFILLFALFKTLTDFHLAWLGVVISTGTYPFFIALVLTGRTKKTIFAHLKKARIITALGTLLTIASSWPFKQNPILPLVFVVVGIVLFIIYMRWYSLLEKKVPRIKVGEQLPMFSLEYPDRREFNSLTLFDTNSLILFYRGNWCPFCVSQVAELANNYEQFRDREIQLIFISSQPRDKIRYLSERVKATNTFLYDKDNKLAKEWNIDSQQSLPFGFGIFGYKKDTVLPTMILTDKKRRIGLLEQPDNYRLRQLVDELFMTINKKCSDW